MFAKCNRGDGSTALWAGQIGEKKYPRLKNATQKHNQTPLHLVQGTVYKIYNNDLMCFQSVYYIFL